jgi:hypothetical protein
MVSFHDIKRIMLTEPKRSLNSSYTNELIIETGDKEYRFDLFSLNPNSLRIHDEQIKTLRSIFQSILTPEHSVANLGV